MYRNIFALTLVVAMASFVPAAQSGSLCDDDDDDEIVCSIKKLIPRSLPTLPTAPPKASTGPTEQKAEKQVQRMDPQQPAPKVAESNAKIVERTAPVALPDIAPACKKYFPTLGEMLPIPCE